MTKIQVLDKGFVRLVGPYGVRPYGSERSPCVVFSKES
jgi:hypothetical protein